MGTTNKSASTVSCDNTEQIPLKDTLKYMEDGEVIRDSHCGFTKGKSCLSNLGSFHDRVTASPDNGDPSTWISVRPYMRSQRVFVLLNWKYMSSRD